MRGAETIIPLERAPAEVQPFNGSMYTEGSAGAAPSQGSGPETSERFAALLREGKIEEFNRLRPAGELNLRRISLRGCDLSGVDLRNADLTGADLRGVILNGARLQHAIFDRADISDSVLTGAKAFQARFRGADLTRVRGASGAEFHEANFRGADLGNGDFRGAIFSKAGLMTASLAGGKFSGADLSEAMLMGAMLSGADFTQANFFKARLFQANGKDVNFSGANLVQAEAINSFFTSSNKDAKDGQRTNFDGAWVKGFRHDDAIDSSMLRNALSTALPPEGYFPRPPAPTEEKILVHGIPGSDRVRFDKAMKELDDMIGLHSVKRWAKELVDFLLVKLARERVALPELDQTLHMVFIGSPGTGKTTVARILSDVLASLAVLSKGHLLETDKAGLIAGYQGQTVAKTKELVDQAMGGTLLIDEFYALLQDENDSYAKDAVAILTKRLEDDRQGFCCIACGYTRETMRTLEANSGLKSRFSQIVAFPDYTSGELIDIIKLQMKKKEFKPERDFLAAASMLLAVAKEKEGEQFGNGRTVRNMFEKTYKGPMASRLVKEEKLKDREALRTPLVRDLPFEDVSGLGRDKFPPLEKLSWVDETGKMYRYNELPLDGPFPSLTQESVHLLHEVAEEARRAVKAKFSENQHQGETVYDGTDASIRSGTRRIANA